MKLLPHIVAAWTMLGAAFLAEAQVAPIVLDGNFEDWTGVPGLVDLPTGDAPAVDLVEMKVSSDADFLYVYVRLGAEVDLTDVLYPHNLFLQIDVDMDASTGFLVREGFGSELGIDFNGLFAYTNFGPADQVNFSEIGLIPAPTVTSTEFELALRRDAVLEGGNVLFPQDSIRLLFRDAQFDDDLPNAGLEFVHDFNDAITSAVEPLDLAKADPTSLRVCAYNVVKRFHVIPR